MMSLSRKRYWSQNRPTFSLVLPCLKDTTLYNVCAVPWGWSVPWGVFSTVGVPWVPWGYHEYRGGTMSTVGGYLEYRGCVQYRGGYHDECGGYLECRGGVQYRGDIMSTVGVILSTVGDVQYHGGYHDACGGYHEYCGGCSVPWGESLLLFEYPMVLNIPHGTHDIPPHASWYPPTCIMISPHGTQISKDGIPTVLNTLHGTHDIPHMHHDIPHGTEHPPWYSR